MSVIESAKEQSTQAKTRPTPKTAPVNRVLDFLSLVKFGVILLCILVVLSMLGMLIIQQNVSGFDAYYAGLTPAEKTVFGALGLFDIYHSWYYNLLLLVLSLNIVLASIDRFPSAWSYVSKPKLTGTRKWIEARKKSATVRLKGESKESIADKVSAAMKRRGMKPVVTEQAGSLFVFGQSGKYNRLGAYIVHVCLLTLFLGHFVALQTGFDADVPFEPGQTSNEIEKIEFNLDKQERFAVGLPFSITCLDIQQKLIDPGGSIETFNTLDWRTRIRIDDPQYGATVADVALNRPFSYRGYRFFQAQTVPIGNARIIKLEITPEKAGAKPEMVDIQRTGSATMKDGTHVSYAEFLPDFTFNQQGQPDTRSRDYNNPVAVLTVTPKNGEPERVFAFAGDVSDKIPVGAPKLGYKWRLKEFEKSPRAHILSIKYDPYNGAFIAWYFGGIGLIFALMFVFFFSHKRVWAQISQDKDEFEVLLGGEANRNHQGFEERFERIVNDLETGNDDPVEKGE